MFSIKEDVESYIHANTWKMSKTDIKKPEESRDATAYVFKQTWFCTNVDYTFKFFINSSLFEITIIIFLWLRTQFIYVPRGKKVRKQFLI